MVDNLLESLQREYAVYNFYANKIDSISNILAQSHMSHINVIKVRLLELNVESSEYLESNLVGEPLVLEESLISFYSNIESLEQDSINLDLFYKIEANIYNNHLPLLQNRVPNLATQSVLNQLNTGKELIGETQEMLYRLQNGELSQGELEGFLNKLNYSLIGGMIAGGLGAMVLNEFLNKNKNEEE